MVEHGYGGLPQGQYGSYQINHGQIPERQVQFMAHSTQYHPAPYQVYPAYQPGFPGPQLGALGMPTEGPNPSDNVFSAHYLPTVPAPLGPPARSPATRGSSTLSESERAPPVLSVPSSTRGSSALESTRSTGPSEPNTAPPSKPAPIAEPTSIVRELAQV